MKRAVASISAIRSSIDRTAKTGNPRSIPVTTACTPFVMPRGSIPVRATTNIEFCTALQSGSDTCLIG